MMKVTIFKITVNLYPSQGENKWVTDNWHRNYKGRVLEGIESEKQHATNQICRTTMHRCIGTRTS